MQNPKIWKISTFGQKQEESTKIVTFQELESLSSYDIALHSHLSFVLYYLQLNEHYYVFMFADVCCF